MLGRLGARLLGDEVEDDRVALLRRAAGDRHQLRNRIPDPLELRVDDVRRDFGSGPGTSRLVQSASSGFGATGTVATKLNVSPCAGRTCHSTSGPATGRTPAVVAASQNQPSIWLRTASSATASRPTRATTTGIGTFPVRKPGTLIDPARSEAACSSACSTASSGTSISRRTLLSGSSSTFVFTNCPFNQMGGGQPAARHRSRAGPWRARTEIGSPGRAGRPRAPGHEVRRRTPPGRCTRPRTRAIGGHAPPPEDASRREP